ncbi:MAG TPA: hypothetical protein VHM19_03060 [Polyangiales bacterium]|jgi:hypothetical protein|nr:hypothetical protein [Polyangiales bacterium]
MSATIEAPQASLPRTPAGKALWAVCFAAGLFAAGTLLYGFVQFPDAPLDRASAGVTGKGGTHRTLADYLAFQRWEHILIIGYAATFALAFAAGAVDRSRARPRVDGGHDA